MLGFLVPVGGGDSIPLLRDSLTVGRRDDCDITLKFSNISGHHCELFCKDGFWYVRDLDSSNGTRVNGARVQEKYLPPGAEIAFAKNKYKIEYSPKENGATAAAPADADAGGESPEEISRNIFGKSLLERAGLQRDTQFSRERDFKDRKRYDMEDNSPGQFRDY